MMNAIGKITYAGATAPTGNVNKTAPDNSSADMSPELTGVTGKIKAGEAKPIVDLSSTRSTPFSDVESSPVQLVAGQLQTGYYDEPISSDESILCLAIFNKIIDDRNLWGWSKDEKKISYQQLKDAIKNPKKFEKHFGSNEDGYVSGKQLTDQLERLKWAFDNFGKEGILTQEQLTKALWSWDGSFPEIYGKNSNPIENQITRRGTANFVDRSFKLKP
jgi:hypothetical protein